MLVAPQIFALPLWVCPSRLEMGWHWVILEVNLSRGTPWQSEAEGLTHGPQRSVLRMHCAVEKMLALLPLWPLAWKPPGLRLLSAVWGGAQSVSFAEGSSRRPLTVGVSCDSARPTVKGIFGLGPLFLASCKQELVTARWLSKWFPIFHTSLEVDFGDEE